MTDDNCSRVSSESLSATDSSATNRRKKRKWDQPAEFLVSAGVAVPGILPIGNTASLASVALPGTVLPSNAIFSNPLMASSAIPQALQAPLVQPHATSVVQKFNQKIQDELIAREIVINDADSSVRYKLTKRQTQEEIQKCTGAVVITRGRYYPPNVAPSSEKPLYLHISAGAHLETTVDRIKAVDHAAAMVEEMLKQDSANSGGKVTPLFSTCIYLGFEADPSLNISARIRGPNDQYVNHIMNETGATVLLRGRGSGNSGSPVTEEGQQPLHLFLSSNSQKSLDSAKLLAENLLDTISIECGVSRVSSGKVYGAVPPPQQLLTGVHSSGNEANSTASFTSPAAKPSTILPVVSTANPAINPSLLQGSFLQFQQNTVCVPRPSLTGGTSYNGYGGIYPQATPLQQVALALRQPPSFVDSRVSSATTAASTSANSIEISSSGKEKRPTQRRKFQELPVAAKGPVNHHQTSSQGPEFVKPGGETPEQQGGVRNISTMPAPKMLVKPSTKGMPPPPQRTIMPPPPPPPKFTSPMAAPKLVEQTRVPEKSTPENVPDTLVKLMEYGEEDSDSDEEETEQHKSDSNGLPAPKPFWAA